MLRESIPSLQEEGVGLWSLGCWLVGLQKPGAFLWTHHKVHCLTLTLLNREGQRLPEVPSVKRESGELGAIV